MDIHSNHSEVVDERQRSMITTPPVVGDAASAPVTDAAARVGHASVTTTPVGAAPVVGTETVLTSRTSGFTPSALVAGIVAIGLLVLGGVTAARAGIDSSLDDPVVIVAGYTATALLGLIEIAFGLVLLIAAVAQARRAILFLGITGGVMALVAVFQPSVGEGSLAIEQGFAVIAALAMGALVVTALLPTMRRKSVVQRTSDII